MIKSQLVVRGARLCPGQWLDEMTLSHANRSRTHERKLDHRKIVGAAATRARLLDYDSLVFGHFHTPYSEVIDGRQVVSLECWDNPNVLCHDGDGFFRYYLDKTGGVGEKVALKSWFS